MTDPVTLLKTGVDLGFKGKSIDQMGRYWGRRIGSALGCDQNSRQRVSNAALERRLRKLENRRGEWHYHDMDNMSSASSITSTGIVFPLSLIAEGNDEESRTGSLIYLQSIQLRLRMLSNALTDNAVSIRFILFFDTQQDGILPTVTSVLDTNNVLAQKQKLEKGRFQVIWDRTHYLNPQVGGNYIATGDQYYKKFGGRRIYYRGTTAGQNAQGKGNLYLLAISDVASVAPTMMYSGRLRFTDV